MDNTYYLKAVSEDALWQALEAADLAAKDYDPEDPLNNPPADMGYEDSWDGPSGAFTWRSTHNMLDMIGTIYQATGNMLTDDDGQEYPEMTAVDGYHANLRGEFTDEQLEELPVVEAPATPYRKWAGDE